MTITVLYFARLREAFGVSTEQIELPQAIRDISSLTRWLRERGGVWDTELAANRTVRAAVNQVMAAGDTAVKNGDEIAFFPPVTGG
jgi:molybdopterin synthase sulfur carrier subunit